MPYDYTRPMLIFVACGAGDAVGTRLKAEDILLKEIRAELLIKK